MRDKVTGRFLPVINRTLAERFWEKVDKSGGECWIWTAGTDGSGGYGTIGITRSRMERAHRVSWMLAHNQPIPKGGFICHDCPGGDRKDCVRPEHLYLSDHAGNTADAVKKGQFPTGDRSYQRLHPEHVARGERLPQAKLTEDRVREIRRRYALGDVLQQELAAEFGVSFQLISLIVHRRIWRHVT